MPNQFQSEHFTLHRLAKGVYAAVATEMGAAFSNAGLVDLGDRTLVFDAFENSQAAEDLLKASRQLTGREPATAIVSHWHPDHWGGLQIFAGSAILATPAACQAMQPITKEMRKDKKAPSGLENDLRRTEEKLAAETDPQKRRSLQMAVARLRHNLQALPLLEPTLPNQTFDGKIVFCGSKRTAELFATGKGHTDGDCVLCLPKEGIAFIGDLGFFQSAPFMAYGFPVEWASLLDEMATWEFKTYVPGHGPVGEKADLALEAKYIRALEAMVQQVVQSGGTVNDALKQVLPPPFDAWQVGSRRFEANVRASFKRLSAG